MTQFYTDSKGEKHPIRSSSGYKGSEDKKSPPKLSGSLKERHATLSRGFAEGKYATAREVEQKRGEVSLAKDRLHAQEMALETARKQAAGKGPYSAEVRRVHDKSIDVQQAKAYLGERQKQLRATEKKRRATPQ